MSITREDEGTLVDSFVARMDHAAEQQVCAHEAFPEVMESESLCGLVAMLMEGLVEAANSGLSYEELAAGVEHSLVIVGAYGMALGALTAVDDAFTITFDQIPAEFLDWFGDDDADETEKGTE